MECNITIPDIHGYRIIVWIRLVIVLQLIETYIFHTPLTPLISTSTMISSRFTIRMAYIVQELFMFIQVHECVYVLILYDTIYTSIHWFIHLWTCAQTHNTSVCMYVCLRTQIEKLLERKRKGVCAFVITNIRNVVLVYNCLHFRSETPFHIYLLRNFIQITC